MKLFHKIHLWLSVPFGLIVALVCFSGAMLVFEPEITRYVRSDVYYVASSDGVPMPMIKLMETVRRTLPDSVSITGVTVFSDRNRTYQVALSKPRRAAVFIDQYSGRITGKYERIGFFSSMFGLHRWLLDNANPHGDGFKVGKNLVGISTICFVIALITGVVIWVPRARKNIRRSLVISFRKGWPEMWKSLHIAGGMYVFVFVLAMSLTGLTWSFEWYRAAFYAACGVEYTPRNSARTVGKNGVRDHIRDHKGKRRGEGSSRPSQFTHWQQVLDELRTKNPGASKIVVGDETASVSLSSVGNGRAADRYTFNRNSGELRPSDRYVDSSESDRLRGWIYAIHTGGWGGMFTRVIWFLSALFGASLPLTGYYIWLRRICMKKRR
ncbi:MAG: PepSY domain-containing protein [Duncaniella sp.]|nr:PepSY domain-containing protein [Duncaniella sp.]